MDSKEFPFEEESKSSMKEWILKTFKRRECIKFVQCKNNTDKCVCGKKIEDHVILSSHHPSVLRVGSSQTWKIQTHTDLFQTNAFGTLEFQVAEALTTKAEYIRFSFDTKPHHIIKLLKSYWQLELPKLIISIHGGIANFSLQPKLKQAIERGLMKVANTSKIWIITSGTDTGVVKHIGDVLRNHFPKSRNNIVAFGIAPWGVVSGRESLMHCGSEIPYYSNRQFLVQSGSSANLNDCHSYFLLVDDGTSGKYGCEIGFRRRLEKYLSRHKSEIYIAWDTTKHQRLDMTIEEKIILTNQHTIPLVCLVIEGGTNTIQSVLVNVQSKPLPVPVVVCDGSGRAADLIAFTHKYAHTVSKKPEMDADLKEQLINTIIKTFAYKRDQAENIFVQLMNCVCNKDYVMN